MQKAEVVDLVILGELDQKFAEVTALVPSTEVGELQQKVENLSIETDADMQDASGLGGTVAGMISRIEGHWESWREYYYRRYKAVMNITQNGVTTADAEGNPIHRVTGTNQLTEIRKAIEFKMREYNIRRKQAGVARQAALDRMIGNSVTTIEAQITDLMLDGDVEGARKLRHEASNIHPVAIMQQDIKLEGTDIRQPYKWLLEPDTEASLMKVIKAIAAGEVALMHEIIVKGKTERRCLVELSSVVLNAKTREMGPDLHIPGILIEQDVNFAFQRKAAG